MIKAIDIDNFGTFKDFNWNNEVNKECEFSKVNIIYGRNYSGKTTLSRIFRCLEKNELHCDYENPNFNFHLDLNTINTSNLNSHDIELCVYNTDFVKENLNWLRDENGEIEPFAILGGNNNQVEKEINEISNRLGDNPNEEKEEYLKGLLFEQKEALEKYNTAKSNHKQKSDNLEKKLKEKANKDIKTNSLYKNVNYNISTIKKDIDYVVKHNFEVLSDDTVNQYKKFINEDIKPDIDKLTEKKPNFESYYLEVKELIGQKIQPSKPIQDLLSDNLLQEWVRNGIKFHKDKRDSCAFCGNPIDTNLWEKIAAHFNKESEELRDEINNKINQLEAVKGALDGFIKFSKENFYSSFYNEIEQLLINWNDLKKRYSENIDKLIKLLYKRRDDIFTPIIIEEVNDVSNDIFILIQNINKFIEDNNVKTDTLADEQKKARECLRLSEIAKFMNDIDYVKKQENIRKLKENEDELKSNKVAIDIQINDYNEKLRKLKTQLKDESKGAELVNEYLNKFFGNSGFKLVTLDETTGVKYKIVRGDSEAKNLSEGECSLISFCYFIAKIKDKLEDTSNPNNLILYIDDPISSLDSNHIFFVFSLIEHVITKPKGYKQLFISTHNLDFLKFIKRLTIDKNNIGHFLIELQQRKNDKKSVLRLMPKHLKNFTTEFNYLFSELYRLYKNVKGDRKQQIQNTYNQFYNIPNNMRKFLEYYLFYRYPNSESPLDNLNKLFDDNIPILLNRVINEYSHLTFIDRGWNPMDVSEIEECVKIIIEKIQEKDIEQYKALVQSIGKSHD